MVSDRRLTDMAHARPQAPDQTCGFCARTFAQDEGQPTCAACPLKGGCQFLRCPYCGYENPVTPLWLTRLRSWLEPSQCR
jgi:hypothetical protein